MEAHFYSESKVNALQVIDDLKMLLKFKWLNDERMLRFDIKAGVYFLFILKGNSTNYLSNFKKEKCGRKAAGSVFFLSFCTFQLFQTWVRAAVASRTSLFFRLLLV